jgi:hypothetical protein
MINKRIGIHSALALVLIAATTSVVHAEDPTPSPDVKHYRVKQLLGTTVHIEGDVAVGTVDDVVFDDNGAIEYMIVLNDGKLVTIPWEAAKFNFEKRSAMVNIAPAKFQRIPTFTVNQYPVFSTPAYRTQTYQYYGLTPGQARRLNRVQ